MGFNWLDIVLILFPVIGAITGFWHGMVKEISGLIGMIAAIFAAVNLSGLAANYMRPYVEWSEGMLSFAAFVAVLMGVLLIMALFAKLIESLLPFLALGGLNRALGALVGMIKGFLWLSILLLLVDAVDRRTQFIPTRSRTNSMLYEPVRHTVVSVFPRISDADWYENGKRILDENPIEI